MVALLYVAAYLVGAVPFGVLVARARGVDILHVGSGNIGATNVWRTLGMGPGLVVFALDVAKGLAPALALGWYTGNALQALLGGLAAVAGHSLSPFLRFRGGKGVSTGLGALLGSVPEVAGVAFAVFAIVLLATRWVSLGSILASLALVGASWAMREDPWIVGLCALLAAFVVFKHRGNIRRLLSGTEPKFTFGAGRPTGKEAAQ